MRPLRIAHVTATFPPYPGGTGNVCYYQARELARRGHYVTVLTAAAPGAPAHKAVDVDADGLRVRRLRPLLRVGNAPLLPGLVAALRGFEIVHLHYPFILGAELVRLAAACARQPLVLSFHNDLIGDGARALIFRAYQRISAWLSVRGAQALCAVSLDHYRHSQLARDLGPTRLPVIDLPNGVDTEHFAPGAADLGLRARYGIAAGAPLLLFVAALDRAHHFKGLSTLLAALRERSGEERLLIVGDGDMRVQYEEQVTRLGLQGRATFAGAVDHSALPPFYRTADLTVLPSHPPESFGLVLIESLACGTPVIASNIPGVRAVVAAGDDGLLVPPGDPVALARAIGELIGDPARRSAMGLVGRRRACDHYDWRQIGGRLEALYSDLRSGAGASSAYQVGQAAFRRRP
jgi:glycosyltransferase involved in cell wall biosynthesis